MRKPGIIGRLIAAHIEGHIEYEKAMRLARLIHGEAGIEPKEHADQRLSRKFGLTEWCQLAFALNH